MKYYLQKNHTLLKSESNQVNHLGLLFNQPVKEIDFTLLVRQFRQAAPHRVASPNSFGLENPTVRRSYRY